MPKEVSKYLIKILYLRKIIRKLNIYNANRLFAKLGIGVIKQELCPNLRGQQQFQLISTINVNSNIKETFNIATHVFSKQEIKLEQTDFDSVQIEYIYENAMIISGGSENLENRFVFNFQDLTENFQMLFKRFFHRTKFNRKKLVYIISGVTGFFQEQDVADCEIFDISSNIFRTIKSIETSVQNFGCDQTGQQIYAFGGYNQIFQSNQDKIQIYDSLKNEWKQSVYKLSRRATTSAIYIPRHRQFLIYANGSNFLTHSFDLKKIEIGRVKYSCNYGIFDYTQPILSENIVFQFNYCSDLFTFNLRSGKWEKIQRNQIENYYLKDLQFTQQQQSIQNYKQQLNLISNIAIKQACQRNYSYIIQIYKYKATKNQLYYIFIQKQKLAINSINKLMISSSFQLLALPYFRKIKINLLSNCTFTLSTANKNQQNKQIQRMLENVYIQSYQFQQSQIFNSKSKFYSQNMLGQQYRYSQVLKDANQRQNQILNLIGLQKLNLSRSQILGFSDYI